MEIINDTYSLSNREIAEDIGRKIRRIRLNKNITREELQQITGIHSKTIGDAENGKNVTVITLISILRGLNALELLDRLLEEERVSPVALAMSKGKVRKRASRKD